MIGLERIGRPAATAQGVGRGTPRGAGFSVPSGRAEGATATTAAAEVSLGGMLALQEQAESGLVRDRAARRHGLAVLEELARLQRALLGGRIDPTALRGLAALAETVPEAADPELRQAVADVVLRARVELARHESVTNR